MNPSMTSDLQVCRTRTGGKTKLLYWTEPCDSRSAFFKDCLFWDGLEITLIILLWKEPTSCLLPRKSRSSRQKCFLLSWSEMKSDLAQANIRCTDKVEPREIQV